MGEDNDYYDELLLTTATCIIRYKAGLQCACKLIQYVFVVFLVVKTLENMGQVVNVQINQFKTGI